MADCKLKGFLKGLTNLCRNVHVEISYIQNKMFMLLYSTTSKIIKHQQTSMHTSLTYQ